MSPIHCFDFFIFSICIHLFSLFTYLYYNSILFTNSLNKDLKINYDYIIVGSGTAGSLIAQRLAAETNYTFVVVEAGGSSHYFHDIPAFGPLLHGSVYDWQYKTVPQEHACFAMYNQQCVQTQGKILGGSAKLNNMVHVQGNISHYVEWFHGKYTKEFILDQFDYIEKNIFHLNDITYDSEFSDLVLKAAKELGYSEINEFNIGFMKSKLTQKNGKRWTTSEHLPSKYILTNTMVEKLLIRDMKCYGIKISGGLKLYAKKGVIVAAGTFNSAKLLQLSGIGPSDVLKPHNIPVIKELPVGKNLQDHIGTGLDLLMFDKHQSVGMWDIMNPISIVQYFLNGNGPFTTPGCEVVGFVSTKNITTPDIQFMVLPVGISADRGSHLRKLLGITDNIWYGYFEKLFHKHTATIMPIILHPKSTGEVKIQSKDPQIPPLINPNYLSNKIDVETLKEGLKVVKRLIESESMRKNGAHLNNISFPDCVQFDFFSDSYLECYIKHLTLTSFHPVGTCSMGLSDSNKTIVDTSFKVLGIDNLYVVDGSVLPTIPSANINAAIALMANIFFVDVIKYKYPKHLYCDKVHFKFVLPPICTLDEYFVN